MLSTEFVDLLLDASGDLSFDGGDLAQASGLAAISQGIRIAIQMVRGEWFADLDEGVPYFEREGVLAEDALIGQKFDQGKALRAFRAAIERAPGVNAIASITVEFARATRSLLVTWVVSTEFGDTPPETLAIGV